MGQGSLSCNQYLKNAGSVFERACQCYVMDCMRQIHVAETFIHKVLKILL